MRKKIQDLAYGRFQHEKPSLQFSSERLEFEVLQEERYSGSFSITSVNGVPMRGLIYSSNPRMKCLTREFEGQEAEIQFEFQSKGLVEGDVQKGEFTIICNGGEYDLSFVASVTRFYALSSIGKIRNLFDFANLAQVSYEEAFRIFRASFFPDLFKETDEKEHLFYRGLGMEQATLQGMEEFLIGIRKKQRVKFFLEEKSGEFSCISEDIQERFRLKKDTWGYLNIHLTSDCDWLMPVKPRITTAEFVGNSGTVEYMIKKDRLHSGKNFGRLTLESLGQTQVYEVCVHQGEHQEATTASGVSDTEENRRKRREIRQLNGRLLQLYLDYRLGRIVTGVWSKESCTCILRLREIFPENLWYMLYQAQALLVNRQRQEAEWILDDFCRQPVKKGTPLYGYYLYVCTLQEQEPSYTAKILRQIQEIYHRNQEEIRLFYMMLFLDPQLNQSKSRKLSAIEEKVKAGNRSPILYMEAYELMKHDVYVIQRAGEFELQVLNWAVKEGVLTEAVAGQVNRCMEKVRQFHPLWYGILKACYQVSPEREQLMSLCSFCIKWNLVGKEQFEWFQQGIREDLRIAGLYEAWMESAEKEQLLQFPKSVMIYFQYQNSLNVKKQAWLYANILRNQATQKSLCSAYEQKITEFALEQMMAGRIDENLAVLYEELLQKLTIDKARSKALADILYVNRLICPDSHAVRAVAVHQELSQEIIVPIVEQQAYLPIYSDTYSIFWEDERGVRYIPSGSLRLEPMMNERAYAKKCIEALEKEGNTAAKDAGGPEVSQEEMLHLVWYFSGKKTAHTFAPEDMPRLARLLEKEQVSQEYKNEMKPQVIEYFYNSYTGEELDAYLRQVDYSGLKRGARNKLMELMISRGIYDRAYEMLMAYGSEQATVSKLLLVAGQKIRELDGGEEEGLTSLCEAVFRRGKYNEPVLQYLCRYMKGTVRELERLWSRAREFELDTYSLEERFLVQLLYTEGYTEHMEQVFQSYFGTAGQDMVLLAYLSWFSHQYFVKEIVISKALFQCLEQQILLKNPLNDSCRLAYFRWLAGKKSRSEVQEQLLEQLLLEFLKKRMYFAFYQELPYELQRKYRLFGKVFLEYRTAPFRRVYINFCCEDRDVTEENRIAVDDYLEEEMKEMYEGIFVKTFVVFFGEKIPYYIKEEGAQETIIAESSYIQIQEVASQGDETGYDLINGMMVSFYLGDDKTLRQLYRQYHKKKKQAEERFRLL